LSRSPPRFLALAAAGLLSLAAQASEVTVSAAASLTNAFRDIAPLFEAAHPGTQVRLNFGASGAMLVQMAQGAPVDVFASADADRMDQAVARNLVRPETRRDFASNTLVLVVPAAGSRGAAALTTLTDLARPEVKRIALGLPASVPAGSYARSALEAGRLWNTLARRTIGANNVRQVLDYVARGEVDAGFVYATDALLMPDRVKVAFTVPTPKPILYPVAVLAKAPNPTGATQFVDFLFTPAAQAVLARHGFGKP
jgi:molybdate transport system substrate-binding protein